jgi:purine-binding chemotaxis protein CheW
MLGKLKVSSLQVASQKMGLNRSTFTLLIFNSIDMPEFHQFCTFFLSDLFLGLEVEKVQEIIRYQNITRVPLAPPAVQGLINLRGQIVPAVNLRRCLNLSESALDSGLPSASLNKESGEQLPLNVVVRMADEVISILVDEVGEVLEIADDCFERSPETLKGKARELIRGAYKLQQQLLLILDTEKVVEVTAAR